jgi:hypothetical protein
MLYATFIPRILLIKLKRILKEDSSMSSGKHRSQQSGQSLASAKAKIPIKRKMNGPVILKADICEIEMSKHGHHFSISFFLRPEKCILSL